MFAEHGVPDLPVFLEQLVEDGANNPENYDMCAQILEDTLGGEVVSKMMQESLRLPLLSKATNNKELRINNSDARTFSLNRPDVTPDPR